jgi:hypothetical protein
MNDPLGALNKEKALQCLTMVSYIDKEKVNYYTEFKSPLGGVGVKNIED